jgi:uncharacterized low-complexity protein
MKKLFTLIALIGMLMMGASFTAVAQDETMDETTEVVDEMMDTTVSRRSPSYDRRNAS